MFHLKLWGDTLSTQVAPMSMTFVYTRVCVPASVFMAFIQLLNHGGIYYGRFLPFCIFCMKIQCLHFGVKPLFSCLLFFGVSVTCLCFCFNISFRPRMDSWTQETEILGCDDLLETGMENVIIQGFVCLHKVHMFTTSKRTYLQIWFFFCRSYVGQLDRTSCMYLQDDTKHSRKRTHLSPGTKRVLTVTVVLLIFTL